MKERNAASTERAWSACSNSCYECSWMAVIIWRKWWRNQVFCKARIRYYKKHRARWKSHRDIEIGSKIPIDPLQLVFRVCAMWLTGFGCKEPFLPYLDKPLKATRWCRPLHCATECIQENPSWNHQWLCECLQIHGKALTEYVSDWDDGTEFQQRILGPIIGYIDGTIDEADSFLLSLDIDLKKILLTWILLIIDALRSAWCIVGRW